MDKIFTLVLLIVLSSCSPLYRALKFTPSNSLQEVAFLNESINPQYRFYYPDTTQNDYLRKLRTDY